MFALIPRFTYHKNEKLKSRKVLQRLFNEGKTFVVFPLRIYYLPVTEAGNVLQAGFGVSARLFKKAVDRNRIRRLLREGYRMEKHSLRSTLLQRGTPLAVFILYTDKKMPEGKIIRSKMNIALQRLME